MRQQIAGVWVGEHQYASGHKSLDTLEVAPDGTFAAKISLPERKVGPHTVEQSGTWRIEDGVFIQTITHDSQTNAGVPNVGRLKILRIDGRELEFDFMEKTEGFVHPTNRLIFRKQTR